MKVAHCEGVRMKPIANWKNASEYPTWNAVSLKRLAWEFLRRNPDFQSDWAEYLAACRRLVPDFDPHVVLDWDAEFYEHDDYFRCEPPRLEGESETAWIARVGRGSKMPLHSWYAKRWGLEHNFPDPFHPYEKSEMGLLDIRFITSASRVEIAGHLHECLDRDKQPLISRAPKQALIIDYSIPIEQQLNAAKKYLLAHQRLLIREGIVNEFPKKIPRKELVIYLRLLDANASEVAAKDIAAAIYPKDKNEHPDYAASDKVRKGLATATQWRDEWFRFLPSMAK